MRLTVIGSAASFAGAGQACSCYLVEDGDKAIVFDLGHGALAALIAFRDPATVDAYFISHEHADHFVDLYALQALLRFAPSGPLPPLTLYGPTGLLRRMGALLSEPAAAQLTDAFAFEGMSGGQTVQVGSMTVTASCTEHTEGSIGYRVTGGDGSSLAYTSDTLPGSRALQIAAGADVLLTEATLPTRYEGRAPHLSPGQAGELALEAKVGTLVLTHLWPTADRDELIADARAVFPGEVLLAETGLVVPVARK